MSDIEIPLFMIYPRFFSCATLNTNIAKVNTTINLI